MAKGVGLGSPTPTPSVLHLKLRWPPFEVAFRLKKWGEGRVSSVKTKVSPASHPETALFILNKNYVRHDSFFNVQKSFVSFKD